MVQKARLVKCLVLLQVLDAGGLTYPLEIPNTNVECFCSDGMGTESQSVGWSASKKACVVGETTDCAECIHQRKCAVIATIAGDGAEAFWGDCRSVGGAACSTADKASIAFAVSLAIDEQDNLYIADQGNNRIRMMDSQTQTIVTIAGSGQYGFGGDGGDARRALLRKPEGVAVKPRVNVTEDGVGREIYFSDFKNQRIRKLVREASGWKIYTVAGTGTMGDNPDCDDGCDALTEATLWNPRALAFSSQQDLYFVDSGSHKIRKLNTSLGDPSNSGPGNLSTFAGHNDWPKTLGLQASLKGKLQDALPGHFKVKNEYLQIRTLFFLTIDRDDKLWFIDGDNNRIFVTPLQPSSNSWFNGDFGGFQEKFMLADFLTDDGQVPVVEDRTTLALQVAEGLKVWLPIEFPSELQAGLDAGLLEVQTSQGQMDEGYSYWMYGPGKVEETWCNRPMGTDHSWACTPTNAQFARFSSLVGMCMGGANSVYVLDAGADQIAHFAQNQPMVIAPKDLPSNQKTTVNGCPCMKHWQLDGGDWLFGVVEMNQVAPHPEVCIGSPFAHLLPADVLRKCTTENYCGQVEGFGENYPEICVIDQADPNIATSCTTALWGFCSVDDKPETTWNVIKGAAIVGHEKRFLTRNPMVLQMIEGMQEHIEEDLWLINQSAYSWRFGRSVYMLELEYFLQQTSVLVGYVVEHDAVDPMKCPGIGNFCCGLQTLPDDRGGLAQQHSSLCGLQSRADISVLLDSLKPPHRKDPTYKVMMLWAELETLKDDATDVPGQPDEQIRLIEQCKARCALDKTCSGFMVRELDDGSAGVFTWGQPCIFYTQNYPIDIYALDRSNRKVFARDGSVNITDPAQVQKAYQAFEGVQNPKLRLTGDLSGIYVGATVEKFPDHVLPSSDVISSHEKEALLIEPCKDLCLHDVECVGIAYPGCYLLRTTPEAAKSDQKTQVFVKEYSNPKVEEVAGKPQVSSFYGNNQVIGQALLSRPGSCVIDSKGALIVSDTWNQRIRRITGYNPGCLALGGAKYGEEDAQAYRDALLAVKESCDDASDPAMQELYATVQQQVQESRNLTLVKSHFCNFGSSPNASDMEASYTNNLIVLCKLCEGVVPRPYVCPWESLCACRSSLVQVASTIVYQSCDHESAYVDVWHRWVTAYIACWSTTDDAEWLTDTTKRTALEQLIQTLSNAAVVHVTNATNDTNATR